MKGHHKLEAENVPQNGSLIHIYTHPVLFHKGVNMAPEDRHSLVIAQLT